MISERVLKGQTDKLYFGTSLVPPNVLPSGSLALLLSPSTITTQPNMDLRAPDVEGYKGGNTSAFYQQLLQVIAASSGGEGDNKKTPRVFAFEIASKVGAEFCQNNSAPEPLADMSVEQKKQAAAGHPSLCGHYHAWVIAVVKTEDVEGKWGSTTGNKYRNQVILYSYLHCMRAKLTREATVFLYENRQGHQLMYCVDCCRASFAPLASGGTP